MSDDETAIAPDGAMDTEPILTTNTLAAGAGAILALLLALGIPIDTDLKVAILGAVVALGPLLLAVINRRNVYAPATHRAALAAATRTDPSGRDQDAA